MSSVVDEIEEELKCLPERLEVETCAEDRHVHTYLIPHYRLFGGKDVRYSQAESASRPLLKFLAKSPERLAALCRYVRAAEVWIKGPALPIGSETADEFLTKRQRLKDNLQSARCELGIGKEPPNAQS